MYSYEWDKETGGILLTSSSSIFSKEPRPVYYQELDILGFDQYWSYDKDDSYPYMWAEANTYWYRGKKIAKIKGGTLYQKPEIEVLEELEEKKLKFVNISKMVEKNRNILESLVQETIKNIYNTYVRYKNKVDIFYVAFSGGKDSAVVLELVQKALPHSDFKVVFADTGMEFQTTYELIDKVKKYCIQRDILFYQAKSHMEPKETWEKFGPPSRRIRWCCTVHKTTPVINKLVEITQLSKMNTMMITGVRADESYARANYDEISYGKKMYGQYSFHPILGWSSAEIYLYMYQENLILNEAYKYGFNRVGCIMCPNSSEKHEFIKRQCFKEEVDKYCNYIVDTSGKDLSGENKNIFLETGGWKTRLSGRELKIKEEERYIIDKNLKYHIFTVDKMKYDWKMWYKTIGDLLGEGTNYSLEYKGIWRECILSQKDDRTIFSIENIGNNRNTIEFISFFRKILTKVLYCIDCGTCLAVCPYNNIKIEEGKYVISDNCIRCHECLNIKYGCLYYDSIRGSKDMKKLKGINKYLSVGVDKFWIESFLNDSSYEPGNRKTDSMFGFLGDADITKKRELTDFGKFVKEQGTEKDEIWALILCNLVYTPAFKWFVLNIPFNETYINERLEIDMGDSVTKKAKSEFWNSFKIILDTNVNFQNIGLGIPDVTEKITRSGVVRKTLNGITRCSWRNADPRVVLYSLYKFAENCGDYYAFTLTRLLNHEIDSDGISPTEIFGLGKKDMEKILNGLSINYPEFINVSFTHDLDNITLRKEKKSSDILKLF